MKNAELAKKIKDLRNRKGISQEELAEKTNLSLRTIQRIENGESEARGDSLKKIANALNVTPDELVVWAETEDKGFIAFLNLSALSFIAFPLLGIIVPFALWVLKKDKIKYINETGKKILNFQISWCIILGLYYFFVMGSPFLNFNIHFPSIGPLGSTESIILLYFLLYLFNLVLIIVNTIRSLNTKVVFYQPAIPFLR